ncbi:MAG: GDSL-type esterase/lipase family protein [Bacteroidetes bacterium]|nr:GDSL-type esterase/lipase family protein [Bacteroidota bacterium]
MKEKRIFIYGDSITWGYNHNDGSRYDYNITWPGILEKELGDGYRIITEAITGRTTCAEIPYTPYRNGKEHLPMLLESHSPLDAIIIMLGLNDLSSFAGMNADESAWGILGLVRIALSPVFGGAPPKILIIAPPSFGKLSEMNEMVFGKAVEESKKLAGKYEVIAKECRVDFLDSNKFITIKDTDGIHPLPGRHEILGKAVAQKIREMNV